MYIPVQSIVKRKYKRAVWFPNWYWMALKILKHNTVFKALSSTLFLSISVFFLVLQSSSFNFEVLFLIFFAFLQLPNQELTILLVT